MKKFHSLATMTTLILAGCGTETTNTRTTVTNNPAMDCSVEEYDGGAVISCPDGSEVFIASGRDGRDGVDGVDGTDGVDGVDGKDGIDGKDGKTTKTSLIYEGYACGRTIVSLSGTFYAISGQLIELSNKWLKLHSSCSVRIYKGKIQTK